jgi:hypothetical protein
MNTDGGLVLIIVGVLALLASPTERLVAHRRWAKTVVIDPVLRAAVPLVPPARDLDRLAADAEAVLQSQQLCRRQRADLRRPLR